MCIKNFIKSHLLHAQPSAFLSNLIDVAIIVLLKIKNIFKHFQYTNYSNSELRIITLQWPVFKRFCIVFRYVWSQFPTYAENTTDVLDKLLIGYRKEIRPGFGGKIPHF